MSVDLVATMREPITLDVLVATARETMADLLGLAAAPPLAVFADRQYQQGRQVDLGRRLSGAELGAVLIGEPIPGPWPERPSTCHFEFEVGDAGDGAWLMVVDYSDVPVIGDRADSGDMVEAVFTPHRTCVGVVVAASLALAAARCGGGEFVDTEVMMLEPLVPDPIAVIAMTRLARSEDLGFAARCQVYLRQFARLGGWPRDVTLAG